MAKCIYPITIGKQDGLKKWKVVPCGKCLTCRRRRQAAWSFRLLQEMQQSSTAAFLTFTYDDAHLSYGEKWPTLVKSDFQNFMKRLRKKQASLSNVKLKYYACGEYGSTTYRPHYHAIMFNLVPELLFDGVLGDIWQNGNARVDDCNIRTIQYVSKYVMKSGGGPLNGKEREFALMSKGLGKSFLTDKTTKFYKENETPYLIWQDGKKITMPRYYKEKIFDEETQRRFGKEALEQIQPQELNSTKRFEIEQMNKKLKQLQNEKRNTV